MYLGVVCQLLPVEAASLDERLENRRHGMIRVQPRHLAGRNQEERRVSDTHPVKASRTETYSHKGTATLPEFRAGTVKVFDGGLCRIEDMLQISVLITFRFTENAPGRPCRSRSGIPSSGMPPHAVRQDERN
jgi:hypothetical protein